MARIYEESIQDWAAEEQEMIERQQYGSYESIEEVPAVPATCFEEIPEYYVNEINFMLGSIEECEMFLSEILTAHGYEREEGSFVVEEADQIPEIALDIYNTFFC